MSASVATASDRVAAVAAFEEAAIAAVVEDLVDDDTLEVLRSTWDELTSSSAIPSPGSLSSLAGARGRAPFEARSRSRSSRGVVLVCAFVGFAVASYAGLIARLLSALGVVGAASTNASRPAPVPLRTRLSSRRPPSLRPRPRTASSRNTDERP